ncbi:hypothetical protein [Mammaliicoccus sciuri]|uniref:hypothetical protein n=1 Tax=Mammaliicoccus sciuri TaxID=1296 RepID=UPI0027377F5D|nr:hypothetical protein [Mammaliicoccus sciuri]
MKVIDVLNIELKDDSTKYGGISFQSETLREFLQEVNMNFDVSLEVVNNVLEDNGILPINDDNYLIDIEPKSPNATYADLERKMINNHGYEFKYFLDSYDVEIFNEKHDTSFYIVLKPLKDSGVNEVEAYDLKDYPLTKLLIEIDDNAYESPSLNSIYDEIIFNCMEG